MDELTRPVGGFPSLITGMTLHVKYHINKIGEEHCLAQRPEQDFAEASCLVVSVSKHFSLATPKVEAGVANSPTSPQSRTNSDEEHQRTGICLTKLHIKSSHSHRSTSSEGNEHGKRNRKLRNGPVSGDWEGSPMEREARRD